MTQNGILKPFYAHLIISIFKKVKRKIILLFSKAAYSCPICESKLSNFERLPEYYFEMYERYEFEHSLDFFETFNYEKYSCPVCGSSDRNRLYAIYLKIRFAEYLNGNTRIKFLDIAPDVNLSAWIKNNDSIQYRSVDLCMPGVDDKADITNLNIYETGIFDIVLCSHVLEHIENDRKAISEIFRVMKPEGIAIVMVPILLTLSEDLENPDWKTESERWKFYGQNDHVRLYSKTGFVKKLQEAGFNVKQLGMDYFGSEAFYRNAINPRSVLYVVEK
jgi:predicted SAM-dependent methyltransferase